MAYGWMQECGDGIMSAIDLFTSVDVVKGKQGEMRVSITLNGKVCILHPLPSLPFGACTSYLLSCWPCCSSFPTSSNLRRTTLPRSHRSSRTRSAAM